jgi:tRNA A-37 threonylcarbamoyl transferase component Bud32
MDPSATLPVGASLGRWRIDAVVGQGATGTVFAATDATGERAAVKVLRAHTADDPVARARFLREVTLVRGITHPALARVLDVGALDDGRPWFAMPLLRGETLAAAIARDAPLAPPTAWGVIRPVAEALAALHAAGVVHRDVKPDNVFLAGSSAEAPRPILLDLGLARPHAAEGSAVTAVGAMTGTPAFMPPEQWWGEGVGPASDQYALGVTAWLALTGSLPFADRSLDALMRAHLDEPPPTAALPPPVAAWLARCLAKSPGGRFPSMAALIAAGDLAFDRRPRERPLAPRLGAAAVAASLVAFGYQGSHSPPAWMHLSGWAAWPVTLAGIAGIVLATWSPPRPSRAHALACAALLVGAVGGETGFIAVERGLPRAVVTQQFELFHLGVSEANANRFLAAGMALAVGAATLFADRPAVTGERSLRRAIVGGSVTLAALAAVLGAPSAALPCLALALVAVARVDDRARAVQGLVLVALAAVVALTRVESRASVVWSEAPDRAARVSEIVAAQGELRGTLALSLTALAAAAGLAWRLRARPGARGQRIALGCVVLWGALEAGHEARVARRRRSLHADLAPQFALFARLDPPPGEGLPPPSPAPSLRIARDVLAIDDQRVGLHSALDTPLGTNTLALDLSHRLARDSATADRVQLSLLIDARAPGDVVRRALAVAWGVGVRRAELLFTRGRSPGALAPDAPEEAAWVLPRDFVALPVTLAPQGLAVTDERFDAQSARWMRAAHPVALAVGR